MNILQELREIARVSPKPEVATALRAAADGLEGKLMATYWDPTQDNMRDLNGAWMVAVRAIKSAPPMGGDGSQGGAVELTQAQRAA